MKKSISPQYIAGFFDGDGCALIHLRPRKKEGRGLMALITISQKFPRVLKQIKTSLEYGWIYQSPRRGGLCMYRITRQADVLKFIQLVLPHVIIKKRQLELILKFLSNKSLRRKQQEKLCEEVSRLKRMAH